MAQREQANVPLLLTIGIVSGLLIIVLGIGVEAWYLSEVQAAVQAKWDGVPTEPIAGAKEAQLASIAEPAHWVDRKNKIVAIPIDQAMKIVADSNGQVTFPKIPEAPPATAPASK